MERLADEQIRLSGRLPVDERAVVLERLVTRFQAAQADTLIEGERSGELSDSGRATVRSFTTGILRRSLAEASQNAAVAHRLADFPKLAAAYRVGTAHTANLRAVVAHVSSCGLEVLQAHEEALVLLATKAGPAEIYTFCRELADTVRPDRDEAKVKATGSRMVKIVRVGDLAHLDAMLDPVLATQLKATLAAMAKAARTPADLRSDTGGGAERSTDARSYAERSADALEQVLQRGMDTTHLPTQARRRPHAVVHLQWETLLGLPDSGRGLLARFGLIPASTAARIGCDALIRLIIKHGNQVLNVGRARRLVSDRQHAALAALHPTCVVPGCAVPFGDCDIHHLWWWSLGGPTDLALQVPLCKSDHIRIHEREYTISRDDGALVFRDRRGRIMGDPTQILNHQLDLLRADNADRASPSALTGTPEAESRYHNGSWGWTGQNPHPPPGHDPPRADDAA